MRKRHLACLALAAFAGMAQATEYGRVLSSTPITQEVSTPQRVCRNQEVLVEQPRDAAGSVLGAVAGGIIGNTMGRGSGNAAATAAGVLVGAVAGDRIANSDAPSTTTRTVQRCGTRQVLSQQIVGYDVEYEYAGRRYNTRMARDPGQRIALQVSPAGSVYRSVEPTYAEPAYADPGDDDIVYDDAPVMRDRPVYLAAPPAVSVDLGWGYWGGGGHGYHHGYGPRHHRRW